jgi:DNA polymerase I-like protein with 3'-5' exonuclease and polymerase domains
MKVVSQLNKSRMLTTPFGRKRLFMGTFNESLKKEAYAYVPQSTVSDILNTGLLELADSLFIDGPDEYAGELLLQVHDSVLVQCHPRNFSLVCGIVKSCLERPIEILGVDGNRRTCRIPVDLQAGFTWQDLVKVTPPFGTVPERIVGGANGQAI